MFETLDQIDWSALHDAYGPSTGTPRRIRALASPNFAVRRKALDELFNTIHHQGTIYAVSVEAVPFLMEIVASSEVVDRTQTLELLQALSTGASYHEVHAGLFFNREKSKTPEWQDKVHEEKSWVTSIHEQLSEAVPKITAVLQNGNPEERVAAVSLLATLQDNPVAVEALRIAALDSGPTLSAAALSAIGSGDKAPFQMFEDCFECAGNELVRTVAAIQILCRRGERAPAAVVEYLIDHLRHPKPDVRKAYQELPDVGAFLGDLGKALACASKEAAEQAFPLLYEEVERSPYYLNYSETRGVLILAANLNPPPDGDWAKIVLTQPQRQAIRLVADRAWRIESGRPTTSLNIVELLESVGLPSEREEIFAMLAGMPEGVQTPKEERKWSGKRRPWWKFF